MSIFRFYKQIFNKFNLYIRASGKLTCHVSHRLYDIWLYLILKRAGRITKIDIDEIHNCKWKTQIISLTHWGRVTHICVSKLITIGSDNGLSPGRRQAIIWTNAGILLIRPLGTNFSEILIEIYRFSFNKMYLKRSSGKCQPFCLGLNVLMYIMKSEQYSDTRQKLAYHLSRCS